MIKNKYIKNIIISISIIIKIQKILSLIYFNYKNSIFLAELSDNI